MKESDQSHITPLPKTPSLPSTGDGIKPKLTSVTHQAIYVQPLPCSQPQLVLSFSSPLCSHWPFCSSNLKWSFLAQGLCPCWSFRRNTLFPQGLAISSSPHLNGQGSGETFLSPPRLHLYHATQFYFSVYLIGCSDSVSCLYNFISLVSIILLDCNSVRNREMSV